MLIAVTSAPPILACNRVIWYSKLWAKLAEYLGIQVRWIGHTDLAYNRGSYGFEDKDDRTDAFCLAISYFHPDFNNKNKWLTWRAGLIADVNDRILELESLRSTSMTYTQQLRQRLKYEFPECADRTISDARTSEGFTAWVGWLAGIYPSTRIEKGYLKSMAGELGVEITQYTRDRALSLAGNQIRETNLKSDLNLLLLDPAFDRYRPTLEKFGFGTKGSNKDKHMAGAAIAMTLGYRITRLLYDELIKEFTS